MPHIVSNTTVGDNPSEYYGTLVTDGIKYEDGSRVTIQNTLYVKFLSPSNSVLLNTLSPWQDVTCTISSEPGDTQGTFGITAAIQFPGPYTFNTSDTFTWGVNGDLRGDASLYTGSFEIYADKLPSGILEVEVSDVPDPALSDSEQTITLTRGGQSFPLSARPGQTTSFTVASGQYNVKADELVNADETVTATPSVSPTDITVEEDSTTKLTVSYGPAQRYSALDITVGQLSPPLDKEQIHVQVAVGSEEPRAFDSPNNQTTSLRRLPSSGTATIDAVLTLNNTKWYTSQQSVELSNSLVKVNIESDQFSSENIDTSSFVDLPINVTADPELTGDSIAFRLVSTDQTAFIYSKDIAMKSGTITVGTPVAPGKYTVRAPGFVKDGTLTATQVVDKIVVASDGSSKLDLKITRGPNLLVRGFPNYLGFGALSDLVDLDGKDLTSAKVTSVFKYAGTDGAGDAGGYLTDDPATTKTVKLAALVSENLGGQPVLPVMINYTVNLSLGDSEKLLQDASGLEHSFGNLILSLQLAKKESKNEVSAGFIVNPDFLGDNQQHNRRAEYSMPVVEPLTQALAYRKIDAIVPSTITNTLSGYVQAVNWLIRTVAPEATFGWQVNLWGVGSSAWIYDQTDDMTVAIDKAKETADYVKLLGVYDGAFAPDFLAIDRYEADDFTYRGYGNGYCYGPKEWAKFYDFVKTVALELKTPVMPWQIPASRIPNTDEPVTTASLEPDHWGTGGTYIFGDPAIGSEVKNIHPVVLSIKPADLVHQETVESLFNSSVPFDLSYPAYDDFPLRGIFSVLLGGGITTGVVTTIGSTGKWTQEKISKYMADPISLNTIP